MEFNNEKTAWFDAEIVNEVVVIRTNEKSFSMDERAMKSYSEFKRILSTLAESDYKGMVINCSTIFYLHSGTGPDTLALIGLKRLRPIKKKLALCCICEPMLQILKLMQLHNVFSIFDREEDAINFVGANDSPLL
ncbi:MAG: STAS domain-containing protein [Bacteroidales bacterium]|nr:STAS domain-containing protein [Bacteroidales bacterium]MCF8455433.1 STAS domain-containing protein [Bacteroidales bacterium]